MRGGDSGRGPLKLYFVILCLQVELDKHMSEKVRLQVCICLNVQIQEHASPFLGQIS